MMAPQRNIQTRCTSEKRRRCKLSSLALTRVLLIFILFQIFVLLISNIPQASSSNSTSQEASVKLNSSNKDEHQTFKLECEPGEQRQFAYESSTKVWGTSNQQVKLRATLRLKCMEAPTNTTLKYLAEIVRLEPAFTVGNGDEEGSKSARGANKLQRPNSTTHKSSLAQQRAEQMSRRASGATRALYGPMDDARAEPLLEEVGLAATRMKRSVSGWFTKAWGSVKDFFSNIFTSSERSSVSRDQAFRDTGLDIGGQCKPSKASKGRQPSLPFDESVFEDLGPEYYVGASVGASPAGHAFEFSDGDDLSSIINSNFDEDEDDGEAEKLVFFDDPKRRTRRSSSGDKDENRMIEDVSKLIKIPFVFMQSKAGKILEIRFGSDDTDTSVKNFKRHLCDLFATNLDTTTSRDKPKQQSTHNEVSPIGKHQTKYTVDSSANALESLKHSAVKQVAAQASALERQNLVRALALVGDSQLATEHSNSSTSVPIEATGGARNQADEHDAERTVSVLRAINTTSSVQLAANSAAPSASGHQIDRIHVQVKQVQQISSGGRLLGTAGQLSMSLVAQQQQRPQTQQRAAKRRAKRQANSTSDEQQVSDIADLLQVSTAFSLRLVPVAIKADGSIEDEEEREEGSQQSSRRARSTDGAGWPAGQKNKPKRRQLFAAPPDDAHELQRILQQWRKQEARLQLSSSQLIGEHSTSWENERLRLDTLRDQVRQRLNEEFVRNKIRRSMAIAAASKMEPSSAKLAQRDRQTGDKVATTGGELGLGLTQLVLGTGITTKRKGSIYSTLEEVIELEKSLADELSEGSISRLMRDTVKMDKLREHCRAAVPQLSQLSAARVTRTQPFGVPLNGELAEEQTKIDSQFKRRNELRVGQCRRVLQLMLGLGERRAAELALELLDECNARLQQVARNEELGYGPVGKYYRHLRFQFVELLEHMQRPWDGLLDKLVARLYYPKLSVAEAKSTTTRQMHNKSDLPEFVYIKPSSSSSSASTKYNKTILKEEDDFNNSDGAAQLVMTLTQLASRPSITRAKRVELVDKLLGSLRATSCLLFDAPDLDIVESMGNFGDHMDELVARVLYLTRRCKHSEQYLVACVHALAGQLARSQPAQRFLADQLKSANSSCLLKSEIVSTLISVQIAQLLGRHSPSAPTGALEWPSVGQNQVDEALHELVQQHQQGESAIKAKQRQMDQRCLGALANEYFGNKHSSGGSSATNKANNKHSRRRATRAVMNEHNFWDEASCKRWTIASADGVMQTAGMDFFSSFSNSTSGFGNDTTNYDQLDDSSIFNALVSQQRQQKSVRAGRRGQRLLQAEREADSASGSPNATQAAHHNHTSSVEPLRRRHKCVAQKQFGPRNAQALVSAEIVNDLVGPRDENKFLARFRLSTNFLGNKIDVGRMYLWHQRRTTRAHANILGRSVWDTAQNCNDKTPPQVLYMPLFDFNLWLVKVSVGLRLSAEMGFFSDCQNEQTPASSGRTAVDDELQLQPTILLRAASEASAKLVLVRAGMSLASQYSYQGNIRVSRQPDSCMSISSAHQPMNVTFSSWFQLWDNDCHFWGSRSSAEPQAVRWHLTGRKPSVWIENECLNSNGAAQVAKRQAIDVGNGDTNGTATTTTTSGKSVAPLAINP